MLKCESRWLCAIALLLLSVTSVSAACADTAGNAGCLKFAWKTSSDTDRYTNAPTASQQEWFRSHMARIMGYPGYWDWRTGWFPRSWFYQDTSGLYTWADISNQHPEWILRNSAGAKLYWDWGCSGGTCPQYAPDFANPAFRQWWINTARANLQHGYYGIFIDDVNLTQNFSNGSSADWPVDNRTGLPMTQTAWEHYLASFMTEVRAAFPGVEIAHNSLWFAGDADPDSDPYVAEQIRAANVINLERGFADTGLGGDGGFWSVQNLLAFIDKVHALGARFCTEQYGFDGQFSLAMYFMANEGNDLFANNAVRPDSWPAYYDIDLGNALSGRTIWNGLLRRDFEHGVVLANPPGRATVTVSLPESMVDISGNTVTTVSLNGREGAVFRRTTGSKDMLNPTPGGTGSVPDTGTMPQAGTTPQADATPEGGSNPEPGNAPEAGTAPVEPVTSYQIGLEVGASTVRERAVVTLTAVVTKSGNNAADGVVAFLDGSVVLGTAAVDTAGTAIFATRALSVGSHPITAAFTPRAGTGSALSRSVPLLVAPLPKDGTSFTVDPLVVASPGELGATTLRWNVPGVDTVEVHVDSPSGPMLTRAGNHDSAPTGAWVHDGMTFFLQDVTGSKELSVANTLAFVTARATSPYLVGTLTINPDPIYSHSTLGVAKLNWNSTTASMVEIHVGAPNGTLFAKGGPSGTATTDPWVTDGMKFYLQDVSGGRPLTADATIAVATAQVITVPEEGYLLITRNKTIEEGQTLIGATLTWKAKTATATEIHINSPDGPLFTTGKSSGTAQVPEWVTDGMQFFLTDASEPWPAGLQPKITTQTADFSNLKANALLQASPNPIEVENGAGLGSTTLYWSAANVQLVEIHVDAPDGPLLARDGAEGSATATGWVRDGMVFYLQDVTGGKPLTTAHTLATVVTHVQVKP